VKPFLLALLALSAQAATLDATLKTVEQRYNSANTLECRFEQRQLNGARAVRAESGLLSLRKPGRMRWQYDVPAGKAFVSDGKLVYFYSPAENRVERGKLKSADDFRAPLAFLLGKLDFRRDFGHFDFRESPTGAVIVAHPKNDRMPYSRVEFTVSTQGQILRLLVAQSDATVMEFVFTGERLNAPVKDSLFQFIPPAGSEMVDLEER